MVESYALFNPHATLTIRDREGTTKRVFPRTVHACQKWIASEPTCPHWYDAEQLRNLAAAYIALERAGARARTVREFISEFRGLSGTAKQKTILAKLPVSAQVAYDLMRRAIREGRFDTPDEPVGVGLTFNKLADLYIEKYVQANSLRSADTIDYSMAPLRLQFGPRLIVDIKSADIDDFVAHLKQPARLAKWHKTLRVRRPATINRYLSLLRHMFNWAIGREYLERTPFRRGNQTLIKQEHEDNRRHRRVSPEEEGRLLAAASDRLKPLIIAALDTGMRRGEMLSLTWVDMDARPGWLRLRGETTKSGKTRFVPIGTERLRAQLAFLRLDAAGENKPVDSPVFSNAVGEQIRFFQAAWHNTKLRAHGIQPRWRRGAKGNGALTAESAEALRGINLRWHDLRHEYASRLAERGVPLSQIRDLLGHASIVTTECYDNQRPEVLMAAAKLLESTVEVDTKTDTAPTLDTAKETKADANALTDVGLGGVGDGSRTLKWQFL